MAQKYLYGPNYSEFEPPLQWQGLSLKATTNDSSVEASIDSSEFTFVGSAANYIFNVFIPAYGVHNGCPFRVGVEEDGVLELAFDGFLDLRELTIQSKLGPIILTCPIKSLNNNITIFDNVSVLTRGLLQKQGFITAADYIDVPVVKVSKKTLADRQVALLSLAFEVVSTFLSWVQDFLSAISDIVGLSAAIGLVELATLFINIIIQINQLSDLIFKHKDLLLASQTYYRAIKLKTIIEKAFAKYLYTVEWGEIENDLDGVYILSSNNGFIGTPTPAPVILPEPKRVDWGYLISECMETVKKMFNTREDIRDGVAYILHKKDPLWTQAPAFTPEPILVEQTDQYQNGEFSNNTEDVFATTRMAYQYDPSDAWTLTENNDDAHEVHLELINELIDSRFNLLRGLRDIQINYALGKRYDPAQTLLDILTDSIGGFNQFLDQFQGFISQFAGYIDTSQGGGSALQDIIALSPLNFVFALSPGGLQVEDDTWAIPKMFYGKESDGVVTLASNFKDIIGPKALYNNWYFPESPSQQNNFKGQYTKITGWNIPFSLANWNQTRTNPQFNLGQNTAKFKFINWTVDQRSAETEVEVNEPFDTNIKEIEV
jgi:hypothetical protein